MPGEIQTFLPLIVFAWTVITFALGHFIGHRTAVKRDKRKEFNSLAAPIRAELLKQIETIKSGSYEEAKISRDSIFLLSDLSANSRKITDAYKQFKFANSWDGLEVITNEYGDRQEMNTEKALAAAQNLLKLIPLK
ncbi:hypothetical protein GCM10011445_07000 [Pseudocitrobacter faecalis]|uniref:hypothetical protein n=1 Tax=Pseudocitrobacter faecalis TaxID=1398493 RepID=UPI00167336E1|nr:hypothetical protein [Pseudocitrobacter faecalis]GHD90658.1 hypothetical protein GCM10011445_07000 [Pseudocitrobacter faecalis]